MELGSSFREEACKLDPDSKEILEENVCNNRRGQLTDVWNSAGLKNVEETALDLQMDFASFDDYWLPFLKGVGPMSPYIQDLSPEDQDALREALRKRFLPDGVDAPFSLGARAWAVRGTVPD